MRSCPICAAALAAWLAGSGPAVADTMADCARTGDPQTRISACSELIAQSGLGKRKHDADELAIFHRRRGSAYLETGRPAEAIADFSQAVRLKPGYALAWHERGQAVLAGGDRAQARKDYDAAVGADPRYWPGYVSRGYLSLIEGDYDAAIADYSKAIEIDPNNAIAFNNRGLAWRKKGNAENALADYSVAIRLDPRYALAYANRGHAYEAKGETERARNDFTMALNHDPTLPSAAAGLKRVGARKVVTAESEHILEDGRNRAEVNCAPCHAVGLKEASPNPDAPPFRDIQKRYPMLTLRDPVSRGLAWPHKDMPRFNFTGEEIDGLIAFIGSLPPAD